MKRLLGTAALAALLVGLTALAADDKPKDGKATIESITKDMIDTLNKMMDVSEAAKDEAGAKVAKTKIIKFAEQMQELSDKAKLLGEMPPDVAKKLEEKFKLDLEAVSKRLTAETIRLDSQSWGKELIEARKMKSAAIPKSADKTAPATAKSK
jgi:hypothetical protein